MLDQSDDYAADISQTMESWQDDLAALFGDYGHEAVATVMANIQLHAASEYDVEVELVVDPKSMN